MDTIDVWAKMVVTQEAITRKALSKIKTKHSISVKNKFSWYIIFAVVMYSPYHGILFMMTQSFDVFFGLRLNKRLRKQWWGWWFETLSRPLWRHCNVSWKLDDGSAYRWGAGVWFLKPITEQIRRHRHIMNLQPQWKSILIYWISTKLD